MFNFRIIFLSLLVAAGVIASLMVHNHGDAVLQARAEISRQQSQQLIDLQAEQRRLSNSLVPIAAPAPSGHSAEIAKLRAEAEALRKQTNDLAGRRNASTSSPSQSQPPYSPEYWAKMREIEGTRGAEAMYVGQALRDYASDHQEQIPTSLDQIASYLAKQNHSYNGTNFTMPAPDNFEIIFQGSTDQLKGIPWGSIALIREKQTWLSPDGRPTRVYSMMDGSGQTVSSGDNFQSWEAEHVIPAPNSP
jgi:hypothetical protein